MPDFTPEGLQRANLRAMTAAQLEAEHGATTVDDYRAKVEAEFKRRGLRAPAPKPKRKSRAKK